MPKITASTFTEFEQLQKFIDTSGLTTEYWDNCAEISFLSERIIKIKKKFYGRMYFPKCHVQKILINKKESILTIIGITNDYQIILDFEMPLNDNDDCIQLFNEAQTFSFDK